MDDNRLRDCLTIAGVLGVAAFFVAHKYISIRKEESTRSMNEHERIEYDRARREWVKADWPDLQLQWKQEKLNEAQAIGQLLLWGEETHQVAEGCVHQQVLLEDALTALIEAQAQEIAGLTARVLHIEAQLVD